MFANMNINFRVFRRNNKNLILLWSRNSLSEDQRECVSAYVVSDKDSRELKYSDFTPDNPEKFAPDVGGIVISHSMNNLTPSEGCLVRVVLGKGDDTLEMEKDVLPANSVVESTRSHEGTSKRIHLYAMDYDEKRWVPLPHTGLSQGNHLLLLKDEQDD